MSKKSKIILLAVILLAFIGLATKPLWSSAQHRAVDDPQQVDTSAHEDRAQQGTQGTSDTENIIDPEAGAGATDSVSLTKLLDDSFAAGQPVVVVLTYNADCCETTKEFFDKHRTTAGELEKKYSNKVKFAWIDIAVYDQLEHDKLMEVAQEFKVDSIPALVLLDKNRKVINSWIGELNRDEVDQAIAKAVS